jgi:tight adherence protein B
MMTSENAPILIALLVAFCIVCLVIGLLYRRLAGPSVVEQRRLAIAATAASSTHSSASQLDVKRKRALDVTLKELEEKQKVRKGAKPTLIARMRQAGLTGAGRLTRLSQS